MIKERIERSPWGKGYEVPTCIYLIEIPMLDMLYKKQRQEDSMA